MHGLKSIFLNYWIFCLEATKLGHVDSILDSIRKLSISNCPHLGIKFFKLGIFIINLKTFKIEKIGTERVENGKFSKRNNNC